MTPEPYIAADARRPLRQLGVCNEVIMMTVLTLPVAVGMVALAAQGAVPPS